MKYLIEYANGESYNYAHDRADLLERLHLLRNEQISDIRKVYKNGSSQTVFDIYKKFIID